MEWNKVGISIVTGEVSLFAGIAMWMTSFLRAFFLYTSSLHYLPRYSMLDLPTPASLLLDFTSSWLTGIWDSYNPYNVFPWFLHVFYLAKQWSWTSLKVQVINSLYGTMEFESIVLTVYFSILISGIRYNPTSSVFINVPSILKLQWHPFTVTSNSNMEPEKLSIVIKSEGKWSQKLFEKLSSTTPGHHLQVSIEGPYGPSSTQFLRYQTN